MSKIRIINLHVEMVDNDDDENPCELPALFVNGIEVFRDDHQLRWDYDDSDVDVWVAHQISKLLRP